MATNESHIARRFAEAVDDLERLESFGCSAAYDSGMRVTWTSGSALVGYKELSEAIAVVVSERWIELRDEAISRARNKVGYWRKELITEMERAKP